MRLNSYAATAEGTGTGWTGTRVAKTSAQKHSGTYSWQITSASDDSDKSYFTSTLVNGTSWHWTGWLYQATGSSQDVWLNAGNSGGVGDSLFTVTVPSGVWTPFDLSWTIDDGNKIGIFIQPADTFPVGNILYFDDLVFTSWNMEATFGAYTWEVHGVVSGPRGEPIDQIERFSIAQMTSDGAGAVWNDSTSTTAKFHSGATSWSITTDSEGMFNAWTDTLDLPEMDWVYSGWLYQETGQDRDVQTLVETTSGVSWFDNTTVPSGVWTKFTTRAHSDVTYVNLYDGGNWQAGETLYFDDMSLVTTSGYNDLTTTWKARSDLVPAPVSSTITTSTSATATAYSNQRKIDRCSNGVLWAFMNKFGGGSTTNIANPHYSTDGGATWTDASATSVVQNGSGSASTTVPNFSFFIDQDDYAHIVFKDNSNGYIYYRRGTPNAGRTAWTWSGPYIVWNTNQYADYPDIVAHREGTGWVAHVLYSYNTGTYNTTLYNRMLINSSGTISLSSGELTPFGNVPQGGQVSGSNYSTNLHTYPSIDFHHVSDGKTVRDGTPHLYMAWSAGSTGAGKGIRFKKATYSAGTWTWGAEREIDSTLYIANASPNSWINCLFDGVRVIIGGMLFNSSVQGSLTLYERDVSDTFTLKRPIFNNGSFSFPSGSMASDPAGNIYIIGLSASMTLSLATWKRDDATFSSQLIKTLTRFAPWACMNRVISASSSEFIYVDSASSPFSINYASVPVSYEVSESDNRKIAVTSSATATAFSNQRKIDGTSNGVSWAVMYRPNLSNTTPDEFQFYFSSDKGSTWTYVDQSKIVSSGTGRAFTPNSSFFIDIDDYAHFVYKDPASGALCYRRGTPNVERTAYTWGSVTKVRSLAGNNDDTRDNYPDIVVHRESSGWRGHIVWAITSLTGTGENYTVYQSFNITSNGVISGATPGMVTAGGNYSRGVPTYPSIDFNHVGDGKTVKDRVPHLYVAWSAGGTGSGQGIRFRKSTYSAGIWTWGAERDIDISRDVLGGVESWINCLFDGTRVVIGGLVQESSNLDLMLYERDSSDTTTTTTILINNSSGPEWIRRGSMTYDMNGNVCFIGVDNSTPGRMVCRIWDRETSALGNIIVIDTEAVQGFASSKRGSSRKLIEFVYTGGITDPYSMKYSKMSLVSPSPFFVWDGTDKLPANLLGIWNGTDVDPVKSPEMKVAGASTQMVVGNYAVAGLGESWVTPQGMPWQPYHIRWFSDLGYYLASSASYNYALKSFDGVNWEQVSYPDTTAAKPYLTDIIWDGTQFIALASSQIFYMTPDEGVWHEAASGLFSQYSMGALAWNGSLYVAVTWDGDLRTSPDGRTWVNPLTTPRKAGSYAPVYCNGNWIIASSSGILLSQDGGVTWTDQNTMNLSGGATDGEQFIVCGTEYPGPRMLHSSPDGITWTTVFTAPTDQQFVRIEYINDRWITITSKNNSSVYVYASVDGQSWAQIGSTITGGNVNAVGGRPIDGIVTL